ncbi:hypothetical protein IMG5_185380 [Ichthyophthirius multifiliis]|uniref:Kelch motif family protein n=1 Tax=Ichthyophthirius multifiliis TaxID=5932 RepID=G0R3G6_ICHMU|nr:hypothetical protein IMG5_185380 [Ichthyophthirius multifiliis]EGR27955.1 hypothetical protein IMG5_185380 [Ichthyophthirius multifiliis]|eukprot:XP_004027300.1 hypothetical protein IMG5_185380 [Ichthyophthirius multifiliis]
MNRTYHSGDLFQKKYIAVYGGESNVDLDEFTVIKLPKKNQKYAEFVIPQFKGKIPPKRKFHASCILKNNKLYISGGFVGDYECFEYVNIPLQIQQTLKILIIYYIFQKNNNMKIYIMNVYLKNFIIIKFQIFLHNQKWIKHISQQLKIQKKSLKTLKFIQNRFILKAINKLFYFKILLAFVYRRSMSRRKLILTLKKMNQKKQIYNYNNI